MNIFSVFQKIIIFISILFLKDIIAQPAFSKYDSIPVIINTDSLSLSWNGGLNFVQTSNIDLDIDGTKDLFVFERTGNKILPFINKGGSGSTDYNYAPQYISKFPNLHDWVLLKDYNCDGKEDIFTFSDINAGFKVYKNISTTATGLQFTLVKSIVHTDFTPPNGGQFVLYISSSSIPGMADIDNDGDLDIVTYGIGGSTIEYHLNKSMELYGHCDSLVYEVRNHCWGYSYEDPLTFQYTLNDTCSNNVPNPEMYEYDSQLRSDKRHSNSCQLCIDLDADSVSDFVVSNISFPNIIALGNGGTPTASHFVSVDQNFPANNGGSAAVNLSIFPCAFYTDVNNDSVNDLIVSPSAPNISENFQSVIYYENTGTNNLPSFQLQQNDFLQGQMIDVGEGAYPVLFDYDNDGLKDLFIGNYGYYGSPNFISKIAQFKNVGTASNPAFQLINRDYSNLSSLNIKNMVPTFGDLDGDGDSDMIIGAHDGKLHYFENTAATSAVANFVLSQANFTNSNNRVIDVGDFAAPQIVDVDGDSKNDLVIGARNGKIAFYKKQNSTGAPLMDSISHFWGNVDVTPQNYVIGFSYPFIYKDGSNTQMIVGSFFGNLHVYNNIDGNLNGTFNQVDSNYLSIYEGIRTAPFVTNINNDNYLDLFLGNYAGGVGFYKGVNSVISVKEYPFINWNIECFPNPANDLFTIKLLNQQKNEKYFVEIYNSLGQLLISENIINDNIILNTSSLNQGIYFCKISSSDLSTNKRTGVLVKKIIVKH